MKIVTRQQIDAEKVAEIDPRIEILRVHSDDELFREASDAEIVVGIGPGHFDRIVSENETVRWVHTSIAGADQFLTPSLTSGRVVLTCAKGGPAGRNLAEHALALALSLSRNLGGCARFSR